MATAGRNLLDGKKRQASVLGSTLTSLTLNSENDSTTSSEEESVTESESSQEDEINENGDSEQKSEDEADTKSNATQSTNDAATVVKANKNSSSGKGKPKVKVRMKTLTIDGQLVYFCVVCDKIFTRKKDKINHELAHNNETLISCPECGKDFFHESSLAHHIRSHDGEQLHFCDFCPKMFAQNHQLKAHIQTHSKPIEITCRICRVNFKTTSDLNVHHRNKIKEEISALWCKMCTIYCCRIHCADTRFDRLHAFRCSACNELFHTLKKLKLHAKRYAHKFNQPIKSGRKLLSDTEGAPLRASSFIVGGKRQIDISDNECSPSKKSRTSDCVNYEDHMKESVVESDTETDGVPKLKMDVECSRKFCKSQRKPYCKKCNRSFKESSDLISHKLSIHSTHGTMCRVCGEDFSYKRDWKEHICKMKLLKSSSSGDLDNKSAKDPDLPNSSQPEVFECHICTKTFPFHDQLQNHLRLHTNIKSFQCYLCLRNFVTKHYLQRHLQVHVRDGIIDKTDNKIESGTVEHDDDKDDIQSDDNCTDIRFNRALDMKSLKLGLDKENIYNFSDDSTSSILARESDKSDFYQLSSASSHSFKITMARERRKLRKKRNFSKSFLCKRLAKKNMPSENFLSAEKSVVFVDRLSEEEDALSNFVVEINGARSEIDQETTIFVELSLAKLVSKDTSVLYPLNGIDKENKIPSYCLNDNIHVTEQHNSKLFDKIHVQSSEKNSDHVLSDKVMVLDLDAEDIGAENFSSLFNGKLAKLESTKKTNSGHIVSSSPSRSNEMSKLLNVESVKCEQYLRSDLQPKNETASLQPLHSLHLMAAKFTCEKEKPSVVPLRKTYRSEHDKEAENVNHNPQDVRFDWITSGKTCRDIAASWKSNRVNKSKDSAFMTESFHDKSKKNVHHFGIESTESSAFKSVPEKSLEYESGNRVNKSISIIKKEFSASSLQAAHMESSLLPSSFCGESSLSSVHHLPSNRIKCEYIDGQENHGHSFSHHPGFSSTSIITSSSVNQGNYDTKCNFSGSSSTSSIHKSASNFSQPNKVFRFDTDNPALRDMNLMEMVCSIQTQPISTTTVAQPENQFHIIVSSSNNLPNIKQEIDCGSQSVPRSVKTELTYLPHANSHRVLSSSFNSQRGFGFASSLPPSLNLNPSITPLNPNLDLFHAPRVINSSNSNAFRPPFQQPNWSLQLQTSFPPQGPNLMNSAFSQLQIHTGNNDLNQCAYNNVDNLILSNSGQFGMPNPLVPCIANPISDLPSLHFGHPNQALFHTSIAPLPVPLPHPPIPPAMLPNNGTFYLPF